MRGSAYWLVGLACVLSVACASEETEEQPSPTPTATPVPGPNLQGPMPYETLSEYHFFQGNMRELVPVPGVTPYSLISPLFTDDAKKDRFIVLPEGAQITFSPDGNYTYPEGTILVKNFGYLDDVRAPEGTFELVETRLLILAGGVWSAHTYLWNAEQTEATRLVAGAFVTVDYIDSQGTPVEQLYQVPNNNLCRNCHATQDLLHPVGPRTEQLNYTVTHNGQQVNQLEMMAAYGLFASELPSAASLPVLPAPWDESENLERRARSYLEANCAHCHMAGGAAGASGLVLTFEEDEPYNYGVCRPPVATGTATGDLSYDIMPGDPDASILIHRMESTDPEVKMPEVGTLTVDDEGVALIRAWIAAMDPDDYALECN